MRTMHIEGLPELMRKLEAIKGSAWMRNALRAVAITMKDAIAPYPPGSEANTPNQRRWYERGYGTRWLRKDGTVGGKRTSQTLGRNWSTRIEATRAILGNGASYARYVHDKDLQPAFHRARGWKTAQDALSEQSSVIESILSDYLGRELQK